MINVVTVYVNDITDAYVRMYSMKHSYRWIHTYIYMPYRRKQYLALHYFDGFTLNSGQIIYVTMYICLSFQTVFQFL